MNLATNLVRLGLSVGLVVLVWRETGWATSVALGLLVLRAELLDYQAGRTFRRRP